MRLRRIGVVVAALSLLTGGPALALTKVTGPVTPLDKGVDDSGGATLTCPKGTRVISGGFDTPLETFAATNRAISPRKWRIEAIGLKDPLTNLHPFAYCSKKLAVSSRVSASKDFGLEGAAVNVTARCPKGNVAVAGGWQFNDHSGNNSVFWSRPTGTWRAWEIRAFSGNAASITAFATCVKKSAVDVRLRTRSTVIAANSPGTASVACKRGEELLSGGFGVTPKPDWFNTTGPDLFYSTSKRTGTRGWSVTGWNYSDLGGNVVAHAVCRH